MSESNRLGEIYIDDVLVANVTDLPEHKVQAYRVAYDVMAALTRDYTAPRYVKVQVPSKTYPDLWENNRYRFDVRIGYTVATTYASVQLIDGDDSALGENLASQIRRSFLPPVDATMTP